MNTMKIIRSFFSLFDLEIIHREPGYIYVPEYYVPDYLGKSSQKLVKIRKSKLENIRSYNPFGPLASKVIEENKTLLFYDRLYTIYQAFLNLQQARIFFDTSVAEVGVYKGGTSYFMLLLLEALGQTSVTLHCFDTFQGHSPEDVKNQIDANQRAAAFNDTSFVEVSHYLKKFKNVELHKGRFQEVASQVPGKHFSFVHLDVDIYEPTRYALEFFDSRLVEGGIILVDDYGSITCPGVKKATDEFSLGKRNYFVFHFLTGQCLLIKSCNCRQVDRHSTMDAPPAVVIPGECA
jgi:O-methyltransferase